MLYGWQVWCPLLSFCVLWSHQSSIQNPCWAYSVWIDKVRHNSESIKVQISSNKCIHLFLQCVCVEIFFTCFGGTPWLKVSLISSHTVVIDTFHDTNFPKISKNNMSFLLRLQCFNVMFNDCESPNFWSAPNYFMKFSIWSTNASKTLICLLQLIWCTNRPWKWMRAAIAHCFDLWKYQSCK